MENEAGKQTNRESERKRQTDGKTEVETTA
jgi:hypothetical protein